MRDLQDAVRDHVRAVREGPRVFGRGSPLCWVAIDENNKTAENLAAVSGLSYPTRLPVPAFISQQLIDANAQWRPAHEPKLASLERAELVVLDGDHYLHWTHSLEMAERLDRFLG